MKLLAVLEDELKVAKERYREACKEAERAATDLEWANQKRLDAGQKIGRIRAQIMKIQRELHEPT